MKNIIKYFAVLLACITMPAMAGWNPKGVILEIKPNDATEAAYSTSRDIMLGDTVKMRMRLLDNTPGNFDQVTFFIKAVKLPIDDSTDPIRRAHVGGNESIQPSGQPVAYHERLLRNAQDDANTSFWGYEAGSQLVYAKLKDSATGKYGARAEAMMNIVSSFTVDIDLKNHSGGRVILKDNLPNGQFNDSWVPTVRGILKGSWDTANYTLHGTAAGGESFDSLTDEFDENINITGFGSGMARLSISALGDRKVGTYDFEVKKEIELTKKSGPDRDVIPGTTKYIATSIVNNTLQDMTVSMNVTGTQECSWSISETTSNESKVEITKNAANKFEGTLSGPIKFLSLSLGGSHSNSLGQQFQNAVGSEHNLSLKGNSTLVVVTNETRVIHKGFTLRIFSYAKADKYVYDIDSYYEDESPRDGWPDKQKVNVSGAVVWAGVPEGFVEYLEVPNKPQP